MYAHIYIYIYIYTCIYTSIGKHILEQVLSHRLSSSMKRWTYGRRRGYAHGLIRCTRTVGILCTRLALARRVTSTWRG